MIWRLYLLKYKDQVLSTPAFTTGGGGGGHTAALHLGSENKPLGVGGKGGVQGAGSCCGSNSSPKLGLGLELQLLPTPTPPYPPQSLLLTLHHRVGATAAVTTATWQESPCVPSQSGAKTRAGLEPELQDRVSGGTVGK